jgi:hypothetical protein
MGKGKRKRRAKLGPPAIYPPGVREAVGILSVTRCEALIRVIDTAIWLWALEKDPLSIHLLVKSSYQCLRDLGAKHGGGPTLHAALPELQFNLVYDFLRHSSGSKSEGVNAVPSTNALLLYDAIESFEALFKQRTVHMKAFAVYFAFSFPRAYPRFQIPTSAFPEVSSHQLPKGLTAQDFISLDRRAFFDKAISAFRAAAR